MIKDVTGINEGTRRRLTWEVFKDDQLVQAEKESLVARKAQFRISRQGRDGLFVQEGLVFGGGIPTTKPQFREEIMEPTSTGMGRGDHDDPFWRENRQIVLKELLWVGEVLDQGQDSNRVEWAGPGESVDRIRSRGHHIVLDKDERRLIALHRGRGGWMKINAGVMDRWRQVGGEVAEASAQVEDLPGMTNFPRCRLATSVTQHWGEKALALLFGHQPASDVDCACNIRAMFESLIVGTFRWQEFTCRST